MGFSKKHDDAGELVTWREAIRAGAQRSAPAARDAYRPDPRLADRWALVLEAAREDVVDFKFEIWIKDTRLLGYQALGGRVPLLFVSAPDHVRTWVRDRYLPILVEAAGRALDRPVTIEIVPEWWEPARGPHPADRRSCPAELSPPTNLGGRAGGQRRTLTGPPERRH